MTTTITASMSSHLFKGSVGSLLQGCISLSNLNPHLPVFLQIFSPSTRLTTLKRTSYCIKEVRKIPEG